MYRCSVLFFKVDRRIYNSLKYFVLQFRHVFFRYHIDYVITILVLDLFPISASDSPVISSDVFATYLIRDTQYQKLYWSLICSQSLLVIVQSLAVMYSLLTL